MKMVHCHTFFLVLAVGLWLFLGFLLLICSILLGLSGRSKFFFSRFSLYWSNHSTSLTLYFALIGQLRISEIGQIGFFTEVELVLREKKAGKLGGMKNWYSTLILHKVYLGSSVWKYQSCAVMFVVITSSVANYPEILCLQAHIRTFGGRIAETILSLRFFIFQYGVVYKLDVQGSNTSLTVITLFIS